MAEPTFYCVIRVSGDGLIPLEPAHYLREHRPTLLLPVIADAPGVIDLKYVCWVPGNTLLGITLGPTNFPFGTPSIGLESGPSL